ncbi:hypothetical protein B9S53_26470 [Arthrospira sp. O9.13F]|nr:hypothetical protein B9S53_26470 [Arthrospira sp. O9.13F]
MSGRVGKWRWLRSPLRVWGKPWESFGKAWESFGEAFESFGESDRLGEGRGKRSPLRGKGKAIAWEREGESDRL